MQRNGRTYEKLSIDVSSQRLRLKADNGAMNCPIGVRQCLHSHHTLKNTSHNTRTHTTKDLALALNSEIRITTSLEHPTKVSVLFSLGLGKR